MTTSGASPCGEGMSVALMADAVFGHGAILWVSRWRGTGDAFGGLLERVNMIWTTWNCGVETLIISVWRASVLCVGGGEAGSGDRSRASVARLSLVRLKGSTRSPGERKWDNNGMVGLTAISISGILAALSQCSFLIVRRNESPICFCELRRTLV